MFIRSNGLFFIVIPGYFVLKDFISFLMIRNVKKAIMMVVIGLCMIILISIPYLIVACGYPYYLYCYENSELIDQKKPQWCSDTIPNAYDYNQNEHWNVGFLQQYRPSRIIFIYWGMHSLIIGAMLIWVFLKEKWLSFLTLGILGEEKKRKYKFTENWNPFMIYTLVLFMISALLAHTQSCTRFFSSSPCFFWYIASKLVPENEDKCKIKIKEKFEVKNKLLLLYILYFNVAGHFMFSNFLPWT